MSKTALRFVPAALDDALAQPLLAELAVEYAQRYDSTPADRAGVVARTTRPTNSRRRTAAC